MTKVDLAVTLAYKQIGRYGRPNKFITEYCHPRNLTGPWLIAPWCAMFASSVYKAAGLAKEAGQFASCPAWVAWLKKAGKWGSKPKVGALVFYDWDKDKVADHVGIVQKVTETGIVAIEGNTVKGGVGNSVAAQNRKGSTILGYGYIDDVEPPRTYTVRKDDTLSKIAGIYGTTWQKLYEANKKLIGAKPSMIKPGQMLTVP